MYGGGQEKNIRPGTLPIHNLVGFGKACKIANKIMEKEYIKITKLKDIFLSKVHTEIQDFKINGDINNRLAGNLNFCFNNINNEALIASMPNIAFSTGAACASSKMKASHVLLALGLSKKDAFSSVRFGIGRFNNETDINQAAKSLIISINKLKK